MDRSDRFVRDRETSSGRFRRRGTSREERNQWTLKAISAQEEEENESAAETGTTASLS